MNVIALTSQAAFCFVFISLHVKISIHLNFIQIQFVSNGEDWLKIWYDSYGLHIMLHFLQSCILLHSQGCALSVIAPQFIFVVCFHSRYFLSYHSFIVLLSVNMCNSYFYYFVWYTVLMVCFCPLHNILSTSVNLFGYSVVKTFLKIRKLRISFTCWLFKWTFLSQECGSVFKKMLLSFSMHYVVIANFWFGWKI